MNEKKKTGRPLININKTQFESMCGIQCTKEEICFVLGVSQATVSRWCKREYGMSFDKVHRQKQEFGKASLRRMQWKTAEKSATMQIWLGKQYLGQKDEQSIEMTTDAVPQITVNVPIVEDKPAKEGD